MKPRVTLITLGVTDLPRAVRFYRDGLGWPTGMKDGEDVAFFQLGGGVALALWGRDALAQDADVPPGQPSAFNSCSLAQNLGSKAEVDEVMRQAEAAGGTIRKPAEDTFWGGYSGYFADPDGHLWEVAWNPFWTLTSDGGVELPSA
jgi:catechol 2,3-dioxygenase-like lactoylglutathione lyase family enzyme